MHQRAAELRKQSGRVPRRRRPSARAPAQPAGIHEQPTERIHDHSTERIALSADSPASASAESVLPAPDPDIHEQLTERISEGSEAPAPEGPPQRDASQDPADTVPEFDPGEYQDALRSGVRVAERIGDYEVVDQIGRGSMGTVYGACHVETGERVALKLLHPEFVDDETEVQRFDLEVHSLARLYGHPGIVAVRDAGKTPQGQPYFVMDYVPGQSLRWALKTMPVTQGVLAVTLVAQTLQHAHELGIVHRDIKPENILVAADGRVCLSDFGIARFLGSSSRLTMTGEVVGTPAYMAPEQASSELGKVGAWTDVYGLGCVLYEVLTRRTPHQGTTPFAIYTSVAMGEPIPRPSSLVEEVSPELEEVCLKALARRPEERYPDAGSLHAALLAAIRASGIVGGGAGSRRNERRIIAGLVGMLVVTLVVLGGALFHSARLGREAARQKAAALRQVEEHIAAGRLAEARAGLERLDDAAQRERLGDLLRAARRKAALEAFARDELGTARELLGQVETGPQEPAEVAWILALTGEHATALAALPEDIPPAQRARLAAWALDADACRAALVQLPPAQARALAWELLGEPFGSPGEDAGWELVARGERALRRGWLPIAAWAFARAREARPEETRHQETLTRELRLSAHLGACRVRLARGEAEAAVAPLAAACALAVHPLERARCLGWAAELRLLLDQDPPELLAVLGPVWPSAERRAPGAPRVAAALGRAGEPSSAPVEAARFAQGPMAAARALAGEGRLQEAAAACGEAAAETYVTAELKACRAGRDGVGGLLVARGAELAAAAARGGSHEAARAALEVLERAARLRDDSAACWLARAQAHLVLHEPGQAYGACERALEHAREDGRVLLMLAQADRARIAGEQLTARLLRDAEADEPEQELSLAEQLREVAETFRRARATAEGSAGGSPELSAQARLGAAEALLGAHLQEALARAEGAAAPSAGDAALSELDAELAPLLTGVPRDALQEARHALVAALEAGDLLAVGRAEDALADAAREVSPAARQALFLRASCGEVGDARAFLAVCGDLPARALLSTRLSERQPTRPDRKRGLERALRLLPGLPLAAWERARLAGFARDTTELVRAASAAGEDPDLLGVTVAGLDAEPEALANLRPTEELPGLSDDDPTRWLARALLERMPPERGGDAATKAAQARRGYRAAAHGLALRPGWTSGHLLQALTIVDLGQASPALAQALASDLEYALLCARGSAPAASAPQLLRLEHRPAELRPALDTLLAQGFVGNPQALETRAEEVPARLEAFRYLLPPGTGPGWAQELAEKVSTPSFPRLATLLRLLAEAGDVALVPNELPQDELPLRTLALALNEAKAPEVRRQEAQRAFELLTGRRLTAPAPGLPHAFFPTPGAEDELLRAHLPAGIELFALAQRLGRPETALLPLVERPLAASSFADLVARSPAGPALLWGAQDGVTQAAAVEWLLHVGELDEARLAVDRAAAFARAASPVEVLSRLVVHTLRPWALQAEPPQRERALQLALSATRQAQVLATHPRDLWCLVAHLQLDLALTTEDPKQRELLLQRGADDVAALEQLSPCYTALAAWARVRLAAATGAADALTAATASLKESPPAARAMLRAFLKAGPPEPELAEDAELAAFLQRLFDSRTEAQEEEAGPGEQGAHDREQ